MNEEQKKAVTEWLGECWHEWAIHTPEKYVGGNVCSCGFKSWESSVTRHIDEMNRTFTEPADFFAVFDRLVELGEWDDFDDFTEDIHRREYDIVETYIPKMQWLHSRTDTGHFRLCVLVSEWLKQKEGV